MGLPGQKPGSPPPGRRENVPKITQLTGSAHFSETDHLQSDMKSLQYTKQTNFLIYIKMTLPTYYDGFSSVQSLSRVQPFATP